jgi:hypothetical protein
MSKVYKCRDTNNTATSSLRFEVLYEDEFGYLFKPSGNVSHLPRAWWSRSSVEKTLEEYKEPVVTKEIFSVQVSNVTGAVYAVRGILRPQNHQGTFEVTITDGKLTGVEIIE